jgi:hypothetical protein
MKAHLHPCASMFDLDIVLLENVCPASVHFLKLGVRHKQLKWFVVTLDKRTAARLLDVCGNHN